MAQVDGFSDLTNSWTQKEENELLHKMPFQAPLIRVFKTSLSEINDYTYLDRNNWKYN